MAHAISSISEIFETYLPDMEEYARFKLTTSERLRLSNSLTNAVRKTFL